MNNFIKVLLILLALAAIYGFIVRNKKGKSQEQLLDDMSHDELVELIIATKPAATAGLDEKGIHSLSSEHLREIIRRSQNQ